MSLLYSVLKLVIRKMATTSKSSTSTAFGSSLNIRSERVPRMFRCYPFFTFVKEGKRGKNELIALLRGEKV
jgi:hypothetical protein